MNYKNNFPVFYNYPELSYLDSAATTQKPNVVIDRIEKYYKSENANVHRGIYKLSEKSTWVYENARETVRKFIGATSTDEIIFTGGTTDSINLVGYSWIWLNVFEGDTLLSTEMEHHSNLIPWQQAAKYKKDVRFELVEVKDYTLDLDDLKNKLTKFQPKLLALTHVSNVLGTENPIKEIVKIRNKFSPKTKILVDGAQAVAHIPVNVSELGIDFYAFSGHKMYAPMGVGVLWARKEILEKEMSPFRYGGGMITNVEVNDSEWADVPVKFEGGTPNVEGAVGLAEAIDYINSIGFDVISKTENELTKYAIEKLSEINGLKILGPDENRQGVISFIIEKIHPHDIAQILDEENVAVRAGHHCAQILMKKILKVPATTRASFGIYNTVEDVDKLVKGIERIQKIFN